MYSTATAYCCCCQKRDCSPTYTSAVLPPLLAYVAIRHSTEHQEINLTCSFLAASMAAADPAFKHCGHCHCCHRHGLTNAVAMTVQIPPPTSSQETTALPSNHSPPQPYRHHHHNPTDTTTTTPQTPPPQPHRHLHHNPTDTTTTTPQIPPPQPHRHHHQPRHCHQLPQRQLS
jgi:hypothetical protein